jgi:hypothetical protein
MSEVIFEKASDYIQSCSTITAKIAAIDAVIDKLMIAAVKAADGANVEEYWFDDGHVKIRNKYRTVASITESIKQFEQLRTMYAQRKTGGVFRLIDQSNFHGNR